MSDTFLRIGRLSFIACTALMYSHFSHAQTVIMGGTQTISAFSTAQYANIEAQDVDNSCSAPYEIREGGESTTLNIGGNIVQGNYEFCRTNISSTSYSVEEKLYLYQPAGGPPLTSPQCVGSCVQPEPEPPSMPLLPPPPCFVTDDNCPVGSTGSAAKQYIKVISVEKPKH